MNLIPPRRTTPIFTPRAVPDHPDSDMRKDTQDDQSGQVPDEWITRSVAQERLELAGIHLDGRRIRHLCARNELENFRGRNEKNQPQYFINPASLDEYIAKNRPADLSGYKPDNIRAKEREKVGKIDPEPSGQKAIQPDNSPDKKQQNVSNTNPALSGQMPDGEWVPKAQLDQALETIEFLKDEVRHARTYKSDTAQIANRMLETLETMAVGGRLGPAPEPKPDMQTAHRDGEGRYEAPPHHGV